MKRLLVLVILSTFLLTGCSLPKYNENEPTEIENVAFDLASDEETGIVYIKNYTYYGNYVYTPYYSENGKLCKYDNGEIVEIAESEEK